MVLKKDTKKSIKTIPLLKVQTGSDLSVRLEKISGQTGLSPMSLLQKWILQEETQIGLMQRSKEPKAKRAGKNSDVTPQKSTAAPKKRAKANPSESGNTNYRKTLVKRVTELKKSGISLKKIAETLNEEKVATMSGTGKWYPSTISNFLKSKK